VLDTAVIGGRKTITVIVPREDVSMDFCLSHEEEILRKTVEDFVRERLIPLEPQFEDAPDIFEGSRWKSRARLSRDPVVLRYIDIMENLEKQAEAQGLWHLDVPREYGGMQVSNVAMLAVTEELEKSAIPFEFGNHVSFITVKVNRSISFSGPAFAARRRRPSA
jgi:acyl-CoA dehydrogenase